MKKIFSAFILITLCSISFSCSKDETPNGSTIEGTWKLTSWNLKSPIDLNNDGVVNTSFTGGCLIGSTLNFADATNGSIFFISSVSYHTTDDGGDLFYMTSCSTNSDMTASPITYSTDDENTITIIKDGEVFILTLEGEELSMKVTNGFVATDVDTFETTVMQDVTYIFTKQ